MPTINRATSIQIKYNEQYTCSRFITRNYCTKRQFVFHTRWSELTNVTNIPDKSIHNGNWLELQKQMSGETVSWNDLLEEQASN